MSGDRSCTPALTCGRTVLLVLGHVPEWSQRYVHPPVLLPFGLMGQVSRVVLGVVLLLRQPTVDPDVAQDCFREAGALVGIADSQKLVGEGQRMDQTLVERTHLVSARLPADHVQVLVVDDDGCAHAELSPDKKTPPNPEVGGELWIHLRHVVHRNQVLGRTSLPRGSQTR